MNIWISTIFGISFKQDLKGALFVDILGVTTVQKDIHLVQLESGQHECQLCLKKFLVKRSAARHLREVHIQGEKSVNCQICGVEYSADRVLQNHMARTHAIWRDKIENALQ